MTERIHCSYCKIDDDGFEEFFECGNCGNDFCEGCIDGAMKDGEAINACPTCIDELSDEGTDSP